MERTALVIGNSDGIGLSITKELLARGWNVCGISRSESPIDADAYSHCIADVSASDYPSRLKSVLVDMPLLDLCIYCVGIGDVLDLKNMAREENVFMVNLIGLVRTTSIVLPAMIDKQRGHFIGLSSVADEMLSFEAPSYHASKAGFSSYLEGLALALKSNGISITNIRFGFVDTKMAKGDVKPFMISVAKATQHLLRCIEKKPIRYTAPKIVLHMVWLRKWVLRLKTWWS